MIFGHSVNSALVIFHKNEMRGITVKNNEQKLMDCKTAAIYLGMTEAALRKNIYLRRFTKALIRIGGRLYFDVEKLDRLIDDFSVTGEKSGS